MLWLHPTSLYVLNFCYGSVLSRNFSVTQLRSRLRLIPVVYPVIEHPALSGPQVPCRSPCLQSPLLLHSLKDSLSVPMGFTTPRVFDNQEKQMPMRQLQFSVMLIVHFQLLLVAGPWRIWTILELSFVYKGGIIKLYSLCAGVLLQVFQYIISVLFPEVKVYM